MSPQSIRIRSAIACEDLRHEADGKMFAIGIINPIIGRGKPRPDGSWPPLKLYFLLSLDVHSTGEFEMEFRLRPDNSKRSGSSRTRLRADFVEAADNIPFPIGPLRVSPDADAKGFLLEQLVGENRWRRVAEWRIDAVDDETGD